MIQAIVTGCTIAFTTKDNLDYLMGWFPDCSNKARDVIVDVVATAYVAAFCILFPYSRVQYRKIDIVSIKLAQTLCTIGASRMIDAVNYHSAIHMNQDNLVGDIHVAAEMVFEAACTQLQELFDPCNKEVYSAGILGAYDIRVTDCASGYLIRATFDERKTNQPAIPHQRKSLISL